MKRIVIFTFLISQGCSLFAQNNAVSDFQKFRQGILKDYNDFRNKCNKDYADFLKKAWEAYNSIPGTPKPKDEEIPPIVKPEGEDKPLTPKPVPIEEVVKPTIDEVPQPEPVEPIKEQIRPTENYMEFVFFGTKERVRIPMQKTNEAFDRNVYVRDQVAATWEKLSNGEFDNLLLDCLNIRRSRQLCDWAYLYMLRDASEQLFGGRCNMATLMTSWLYCQSGYQMRMAIEGTKLYLLVGSKHHIFGQSYYELDGDNFYPFLREGEEINDRVQICGASFPKEKSMSLLVPHAQKFAEIYSGEDNNGKKFSQFFSYSEG